MDSATIRVPPHSPTTSLTLLERQVLQVADKDCPMRNLSLFARVTLFFRSLSGGRARWMRRPLANPTLEALRLFFCLNRYPDPVLMPLVRKQLASAFDDRAIQAIAAEAKHSAGQSGPQTSNPAQ